MDRIPGQLIYRVYGFIPPHEIFMVEALSTKIRRKVYASKSALSYRLRKSHGAALDGASDMKDCKKFIMSQGNIFHFNNDKYVLQFNVYTGELFKLPVSLHGKRNWASIDVDRVMFYGGTIFGRKLNE